MAPRRGGRRVRHSFRKGRRVLARRKRLSWLDRDLIDCLLPSLWSLFKEGCPKRGR